MSSWETDEMLAAQFAHGARAAARRIAWLVQEAIGCEEEVEKMPLVAEEIQNVLNNLQCTVLHLRPHRRRWLKLAKPYHDKLRAARKTAMETVSAEAMAEARARRASADPPPREQPSSESGTVKVAKAVSAPRKATAR